ncbi:hypothetical protein KIPB_012814, partial [Kipferlia bialata]|eukprot:g12814.t1
MLHETTGALKREVYAAFRRAQLLSMELGRLVSAEDARADPEVDSMQAELDQLESDLVAKQDELSTVIQEQQSLSEAEARLDRQRDMYYTNVNQVTH